MITKKFLKAHDLSQYGLSEKQIALLYLNEYFHKHCDYEELKILLENADEKLSKFADPHRYAEIKIDAKEEVERETGREITDEEIKANKNNIKVDFIAEYLTKAYHTKNFLESYQNICHAAHVSAIAIK